MKDQGKSNNAPGEEYTKLLDRIAVLEAKGTESKEEEWFRTMVDNSPDFIFVADAKGKVHFINRTFPQHTKDDVIGRTIYDFMSPENHEVIQNAIAEVFASKCVRTFESNSIGPNDSIAHYLNRFAPILRDGRVESFIGVSTDITERKNFDKIMQIQLDLSIKLNAANSLNEMLGTILDNIFRAEEFDCGAVYLFEEHVEVLRLRYHFGLPESFVDKITRYAPDTPQWDVVMSGGALYRHASEFPPEIANTLKSDGIKAMAVIPFKHCDKIIGCINLASHKYDVISDSGKKITVSVANMVGSAIKRVQVEEALLDALKFREKLISEIPTGISIYDVESGQCVASNRTLAELIGATEEQVLAQNFYKIESWNRSRLLETAKRALKEDTKKELEEHVISTFGKEIWFYCYFVPFRINQKRFLLFALNDVSEKKLAEEERRSLELQVQHSQKLESLGVLAGGIAHDFNNLLVGVLGNVELALLDMQPESPIRSYIEDIQTSGLRLAELTQQMLAYSGKNQNKVEKLILTLIVEEMVHLLQRSIPKKVALKCETSVRLVKIRADASQIRQVIMNLITNAAESYGEESGIVLVTTRLLYLDRSALSRYLLAEGLPGGEYVLLEVSDTGCGMDKETKEKIFDPFFSTKFTGRGLGLAAVLGIVRSHGGAIQVSSEFNKGTTVKVLLPHEKVDYEEFSEVSQEDSNSLQGQGMVLLVDDEAAALKVGRQMLERIGFSVISAVDGSDAIEQVQKYSADLVCVLLDLTMPKMDGLEAFSKIRQIRSDLPVILCSGNNLQDAYSKFSCKGMTHFLQKPYRYQNLVDKLREVL